MVKLSKIAIICSLATLSFVCGDDKSSDDPDETLQELEKQINEEIGEARADDISFCNQVAFGSKPCGGPWKFLVYSKMESDEDELLRLVNNYNELESQLNVVEGRSSDCSVVQKAELDHINGRCVAKQ